jgi:hypothetical protein
VLADFSSSTSASRTPSRLIPESSAPPASREHETCGGRALNTRHEHDLHAADQRWRPRDPRRH